MTVSPYQDPIMGVLLKSERVKKKLYRAEIGLKQFIVKQYKYVIGHDSGGYKLF